jgi:DNA processing protein
MGIDAVAHSAAGADNTIAVMANGLDIRYPAVNRTLIESIEKNGLVLSQFEIGSRPGNWSFVVRNEIVVALGEKLVIAEADENSGSVRSAEYAVKMGKEIYVFPHRLGESAGTHRLLREGLAKPIYSISDFAAMFGNAVDKSVERDDFFYFCQKNPTVDEVVECFGERLYEAELEGIVIIENGRVQLR